MNLINRKKTAETPAEPEVDQSFLQELAAARAVLEDRRDEAERAADCLEQAEALRETVVGTVQAAQDRLAAAEQEAARIIADARRALAETQQQAATTEREAAAVEDTGRSYQSAARLAGLTAEARKTVETLASERQERLADAEALAARLSDLRERQRAAQADLDAAKAAVDAQGAGEALQRLTGLTEVIPVLAEQHRVAAARAAAIGGEQDGGLYTRALAEVARFTAERETALDNANPARREARYALNPGLKLMETIQAHPEVLDAWAEQLAPKSEQGRQIVRHADGRISGQNIRATK